MAFESQSLKKKRYAGAGISGDVYSMVMMLPKELEMEKDTNFDLKFHVPDLGRACKVCLILTSLFFLSEIFFSLLFSVIGLFAVSSRYSGSFQTVKKTKPITSNRAKCEKDCYFFFFFLLLGLNLFPFVRVAEKMYTSPGKKV